MNLYRFIQPSDDITFYAKDDDVAFAATMIVGNAHCFANRIGEDGKEAATPGASSRETNRKEATMPSPLPPILDATCGSRMIHFDKDCPDVLYMDRREADGEAIWRGGSHGKPSVRHLNIHPDMIADFTAMPFLDESFWLVVFDPPHLKHIGENAWMAKKYGRLEGDWKSMLRDGFRECMRVLKSGGTLIFKWSEVQIPVGEIWRAIGARPIFGTRCGKSAKTIWATFWKPVEKGGSHA